MSRKIQTTKEQEPIAIIGMACLFPQASDKEVFWRNILGRIDAVSQSLPSWDVADRYLNSGRIATQYGGYLRDLYRFDPREFGIIPKSVEGGEPDQFLAMRVARDALQDAGYLREDYDHRDTGIVLGHSTYLHRGQGTFIQHHMVLDQTMDLLRVACPFLEEDQYSQIRELLKSKLPQSDADAAPGLVPNMMTGRIANRLNFKGPNYLVDAACSSSLLAVNAAVDELRNNRSRIMLAGGVNASLMPEVAVVFTQLGALSKRGKVRPFEAGSDGTLLGEGLGIVVLKRASDALSDGDRIYSIIRSVGQASDGRGHGLLAPSVEGETLAIRRAYTSSGIDPATIDLIEAHGTGIPLGDKTEIAALKNVFGERVGEQGSIAIGSVKSMIGHCIPGAGIAGLIKVALALHHKILPPTLCDTVNPDLGISNTPLYINTETRPWITRPGKPRRAGIDSFGFGGINCHAILEEAPTQSAMPRRYTPWPAELYIFAADSVEALVDKLDRLLNFAHANTNCPIKDIAASLIVEETKGQYRLAMVVKNADDLVKKLEQSIKRLQDKNDHRWSTRNGIIYSDEPVEGKVAFLFPGEGSQYQGMFSDLALCFDEVRYWLDFWRGLYDDAPGNSRIDILFPPASELTEQRRNELEKRLHDMDVGSEAVFIGGQAMHALLKSLGIQPDVMIGHSSGESSALVASGAIASDDDSQKLANFIRGLNKVYIQILQDGKIPTGALLTVGALSRVTVEEHIAAINKNIMVAMDNCVNQLVLFGDQASINTLQNSLSSAGGICLLLPFDRGYHTPLFADVSAAFLSYYENIDVNAPQLPLYSCASAELFPSDAQGVRQLAAAQWSMKVRYRETIEKMYLDGVRYFIEVGPSGNLSAFTNDILKGREYIALATNIQRRNDVEQLLNVLAHLFVNGKDFQFDKLFSSRSVRPIDLKNDVPSKQTGGLLANTLPTLHLSDDDRAALRKLVAPPAPLFDERQAFSSRLALGNPSQSMCDVQVGTGQEGGGSPVHEYAPFLTTIMEHDEQRLVAECKLSIYEDNFLRDHVLSGVVSEHDADLLGLSCVPLMVSLEIMAEACAILSGSVAVTHIENVKAFDWIALDDGELTLEVKSELIDPVHNICRAYVINDGNVVVSADFLFTPNWRGNGLSELSEKREFRWHEHEMYSTGMFHGPLFQSIRRVDSWSDEGIDACLSSVSLDGFFDDAVTPKMVLNPVLLDAFGQLAACWIAQQVGTDYNCFPSTIERIELYSQCPQNVPGLVLRARQKQIDPKANNIEAPRMWQFECLDSDGRPLVRVINLVNIYFSVPNRYYECRRDPLMGFLGYPHGVAGKEEILLWQLPQLSDDFCAQSGGIFLRILACALLSFDERNEWRELTVNVRRRREWLLGRACIKEAVRYWIYQQTGQLMYPSDIVVSHDEQGAPHVDGWWNGAIIEAPEVSLSHDLRMNLAAVSFPAKPVGVDIEEVGRIQQPKLIIDMLTENEQFLLRDLDGDAMNDRLLRFWCAKEAVAKYHGLGLQGAPELFEVSFIDNSCTTAHVSYAEQIIEVAVNCDGNSIIALAS